MQWLFGNDALTQSIVSCNARLKTSTLFEDKISALNELEKLSKEHPLEVGIKSISTICDDVLCAHYSEPLLTSKCIDILMLLLLPPEQPYDADKLPFHPETSRVYYECNLDLLFVPHNASCDRIDLFIKLLGEDFNEEIEMQYNIIQILTVILLYKNTRHKLRTELMNIYGAMNTLSSVLNSSHEFIRNSCIMLLAHLSANDASIQKLIAFDGAFERVLAITKSEDGVKGGMVVKDCLYLMSSLLINNESNQKYFVEIGCIAQLSSLLIHGESINIEEMNIIHKTINILMHIMANCGHLKNTQNAAISIMEPLLAIIAFNECKNDIFNEYNLMKQKCLILLRCILYLNFENINTFLNNNCNLLFLTQLALNDSDPSLSALSESVLMSIFGENRRLQSILIKSFISADNSVSNLLFSILLNESGFGDALRYWRTTSILRLLFNDNNNMKQYILQHKLANNEFLMDILMRSLMETMNSNINYDQRIQIALLLLIICICYESRESIYALLSNTNYMQYFVSLTLNDSDNGNDYNRGLSTYLIALCLEFARDIRPNIEIICNDKMASFSSYLFEIIHNKISLKRFKGNLEKLRNTKEYMKMIKMISSLNNNNNNKKELLIAEIFANEFDIKNDEYFLLKNNRMKINLFNSTFIRRFETIYCRIDKRIIQLISHFNIKNNAKPMETQNETQKNDDELKQLIAENLILKKQIKDFDNQIKEQNNIIINHNDKYNNLRKTYDALNRDHEDLLVFVGHLHDKYEELKTQNENTNNKIIN